MAKPRVSYLCRECGGVQLQWMGKCPDCGTWDSLEKYTEPKAAAATAGPPGLAEAWAAGSSDENHPPAGQGAPQATPLPDVETSDVKRWETGLAEFDRVLGGGLVRGSAVLVGGDPGIGKSTLLLQAAARLAGRDHRVLYVSSEESAYQTRLRAERLFEETDEPGGLRALEDLYILADTNLTRIVEQARTVQPSVLVIDSIQMIFRGEVDASPGSVTQLRRCCMDLVYLAKLSGMAIVLVGHVTKQGQIAGPKLIEHLVDTVLSFEGDRHHAHRVVRAIKNRFGTTLEVALFEMTAAGLREVDDGSLLVDAAEPRTGAVVTPALHGTRCLLVEVQALTATGFLGNARRKTSGLDANRLAMLIAVLEKHGGLRLADQDVFASSTGGLKVIEPAADLALCLAIAGAHFSRVLEPGTGVVGEVGLGGEVRRVNAFEQRVREASRLGLERLIVPRRNAEPVDVKVDLVPVSSVSEAIGLLSVAAPRNVRGGVEGRGKSNEGAGKQPM